MKSVVTGKLSRIQSQSYGGWLSSGAGGSGGEGLLSGFSGSSDLTVTLSSELSGDARFGVPDICRY